MYERMSVSSRSGNEAATPGRMKRLFRFVPILVLFGILVGAVYAGFVATHTFTYPSTVANIVNKPFAIAFLANELNTTLVTCGSSPCFYVQGTPGTNLSVIASSAITGSGVTLKLIQIIPVAATCSATQPALNTPGLIRVPLPTESPVTITLSEENGYNYCIYYTSAPSIITGTLFVNYSATA